MKINDIMNESQLDEFIPLTKQGRDIKRAEKAGAADLKQTISDLTKEFASVMGSQGKRVKTATTDDVINFLNSKNVNTSKIDTTQPMNPKRIQDVFTTLIKDKMAGKNVGAAKTKTAEPASDPKVVKSVYSQTKAAFAQLNMKEKRRLLAALEKDITANAKPAQRA